MALAELGWHLGVMGDDRLPDIARLKAASERLIDSQAAQLGVDATFAKPFSPAELYAKVAELIGPGAPA